jgi:hypothetical protein
VPPPLQVVKGQIWTFEQTQAFFFDVFTPVRMTVIKLRSGGLWVHCPVAPTQVGRQAIADLGAGNGRNFRGDNKV